MKWIAVTAELPEAIYNDDRGNEPYLSDDVAVSWPEIGVIEIANYDHKEKHWSLPNKSFKHPDIDPVYWCQLPSIPA